MHGIAHEIRAADSSSVRRRRSMHGWIPVLVRALRRDTVEVPSGRYPAVSCMAAVHFSHGIAAAFRGATMATSELREQLCAAIRRRSLVMFEYGDLIRVVEPHRFGINSAGHEMLSGWLRAGYSRSDPAGGWRNYLLSDVSALQVLDAPFVGSRPGYVAHDPRMRELYCELDPTETTMPTEGAFIVREPTTTLSSASSDQAADAPPPVQPLAEESRSNDGEVDPPRRAP
jgi:hypothetical protein